MKNAYMIVISDVHLRSDNCRARLLLDILGEYEFEILLINGDLIEDDQVVSGDVKMNWNQFQVIEYLRGILRKKHAGKKVIRTGGNHDPSGHDFINQILGIRTLKEYRWQLGGKTFCAIHGHQFDRFIFENPFLSKIVSALFIFLQKIDTRKRQLTRMLDRFHNRWFRLTETVAKGAEKFARKEDIDVIICGHTHEGVHRVFAAGEYWNSGDWTGNDCSFLTINDDGSVELHILHSHEDSPVPQIV